VSSVKIFDKHLKMLTFFYFSTGFLHGAKPSICPGLQSTTSPHYQGDSIDAQNPDLYYF